MTCYVQKLGKFLSLSCQLLKDGCVMQQEHGNYWQPTAWSDSASYDSDKTAKLLHLLFSKILSNSVALSKKTVNGQLTPISYSDCYLCIQ